MCASNTDNGCGGTASKWPVDAAGPAAAMDGTSKSPAGAAAHTRLGATAPTVPWKTGTRTPVSHSANRPFFLELGRLRTTATARLLPAVSHGK